MAAQAGIVAVIDEGVHVSPLRSFRFEQAGPTVSPIVKRLALPARIPYDVSQAGFSIVVQDTELADLMDKMIEERTQSTEAGAVSNAPKVNPLSSADAATQGAAGTVSTMTTLSIPRTGSYYIYSFDGRLLAEYDMYGACLRDSSALVSMRIGKGRTAMRILVTFLVLLTCSLLACNQESFANEVGLAQKQAQSTKEWDDYLKRIGEFKIDLGFQGFEIKDVWMQAHATFRISFEFDIGEDFHPTHIQLVSGEREIKDITAAKRCLAAWSLSGLQPKKKYSMVLVWEHGEGYKMLTLTGEQMDLTIRLGHLFKQEIPSPAANAN